MSLLMETRNKNAEAATIYAVSELAGVSVVTVSRAFNDYPHVSKRMRERVMSAAREVGYSPRLVTKRRVIAVIVGHLDHIAAGDYKTRLILGIMSGAAHRGMLVEFIPSDAIHLATKHHVDALVEVGLTATEVAGLKGLPRIPMVVINKELDRVGVCAICSDHRQEAMLATECLLDAGHRRIGLVLDETEGWGVEHRRAGYEEALRNRRAASEPQVLSAAKASPLAIAQRLVDARCTAAVILSDNVGLAVIDALTNEMQKRVPEDLSVISLENAAVSAFMNPRLTTIRQPLAEIAEAAVASLEDILDGKAHRASQMFRSELIVRNSIRTIAGK